MRQLLTEIFSHSIDIDGVHADCRVRPGGKSAEAFPVAEHLPGEHDQSDHGNRDGAGAGSGTNLWKSTPIRKPAEETRQPWQMTRKELGIAVHRTTPDAARSISRSGFNLDRFGQGAGFGMQEEPAGIFVSLGSGDDFKREVETRELPMTEKIEVQIPPGEIWRPSSQERFAEYREAARQFVKDKYDLTDELAAAMVDRGDSHALANAGKKDAYRDWAINQDTEIEFKKAFAEHLKNKGYAALEWTEPIHGVTQLLVLDPSKLTPTNHEAIVRTALKKGWPVPDEVLADYPELAKQYRAAESTAVLEAERWVTLQSGAHVLINSDGEVLKGPAGLKGRDLDDWDLPSSRAERRRRRIERGGEPNEPASADRQIELKVARADAVQQIKERLKLDAPDADVAKLTGAMHGSLVSVRPGPGGGLRLENEDDRYHSLVLLHEEDGDLVLENANFQVFDKGYGIGTEIFHNQVAQAEKLGVARIAVDSVGNWEQRENHNGYYTWPRLGFDGDLPANWKQRMADNGMNPEDLPDKLQDAQRVSDFFRLKDGRHLWKLYGFGLPLEFDMRSGSRSRQVLNAYYRSEKRAKGLLRRDADIAESQARPRVVAEQRFGGLSFDVGVDEDEEIFESAWRVAEHGTHDQKDHGNRDGGDRQTPAKLTQTPAFKAWFKDSKVTTPDGKPKVVYHGTTHRFNDPDEFEPAKGEIGVHFGESPVADMFATPIGMPNETPRVYPVYLSIQHPIRLRDNGSWGWTALKQRPDIFSEDEINAAFKAGKKPQDLIQDKGYDGVEYINRREVPGLTDGSLTKRLGGPDENSRRVNAMTDEEFLEKVPEATLSYIVFHKDQIKSATGNKGTFKRGEGDINESASDWDESEHPRDEKGRFAEKGTGSAAGPQYSDVVSKARDLVLQFGTDPENPDGLVFGNEIQKRLGIKYDDDNVVGNAISSLAADGVLEWLPYAGLYRVDRDRLQFFRQKYSHDGDTTTSSAGGMATPTRTAGASTRLGYGGMDEGFAISVPGGAEVVGYTHNADFPGDKGSPTRGELFFVKVPEGQRRKGLGTSLALDALQLMQSKGAQTVNIATTSDEGRALVAALLRDGHISGPLRQSETGKAEYRIGGGDDPVVASGGSPDDLPPPGDFENREEELQRIQSERDAARLQRQTERKAEGDKVLAQAKVKGVASKKPWELDPKVFIAREMLKEQKKLAKDAPVLQAAYEKWQSLVDSNTWTKEVSDQIDAIENDPEIVKLTKRYGWKEDGKPVDFLRVRDHVQGRLSSLTQELEDGWYLQSEESRKLEKKHGKAVRKAMETGEAVPDEVTERYYYNDWVPQRYKDKVVTLREIRYFEDEKKDSGIQKMARDFRQTLEQCMEAREIQEAIFKLKPSPEFAAANNAVYQANQRYRFATDALANFVDEHPDAATYTPEIAAEFNRLDKIVLDAAAEIDSLQRHRAHARRLDLMNEFRYQREMHEDLPTVLRVEVDGDGWLTNAAEVQQAREFLQAILPSEMSDVALKIKPIPPTSKNYPNRAYAHGDTMYLPPHANAATVVHEFGHVLDNLKDLGRYSRLFLFDRTHQDPVKALEGGYEPDEVSSRDLFMHAYTGKYYRHAKSSEVLSMGLQHLFEDWQVFAMGDRDHFHYVLAAITGEIKQRKIGANM